MAAPLGKGCFAKLLCRSGAQTLYLVSRNHQVLGEPLLFRGNRFGWDRRSAMGDTGLHFYRARSGEKADGGNVLPRSSYLLIVLLLLPTVSCVCRCDTAHGTGKAHGAAGPLWRGQQSRSPVLPTRSPAGPGGAPRGRRHPRAVGRVPTRAAALRGPAPGLPLRAEADRYGPCWRAQGHPPAPGGTGGELAPQLWDRALLRAWREAGGTARPCLP